MLSLSRYDLPPVSDGAPSGTAVQQMLWSADQYVGKVVAMLKQKGMWASTFVVYGDFVDSFYR